MELRGIYRTQQEALAAADQRRGSEAITREANGRYGVYALTAQENMAVQKRSYGSFPASVLAFSMAKEGTGDQVLDRVTTEQFPSCVEAERAAGDHPGHEAIVRNDNGSFSIFPLDDERAFAAERKNFDSLSPRVEAVSIERAPGFNAVVEMMDNQTLKLVQNSYRLLENVRQKNGKTNRYKLGSEVVNVSTGTVRADCSGFVRSMYDKIGIDLNDQNAAGIGRDIRSGKGPLAHIKYGEDIRPGDVVSFALPRARRISGHVMIALGRPQAIRRAGKVIGYNLRIIDSTSTPHGQDTDRAGWKSGVGAGTITIAVDGQDRITYMTWKDNFQGKVHRDQVTVGGIR